MGVFGAVATARPTEGGRYFEPGNFVVLVNRIKHGQTRKGVDFFVVETKILESNNAEREPKSECSWMVTMDKDAAPGNIKSFVMCAAGVGEDEIDEAGILLIVGDEQPLAGKILRVEAYNKPTRDGRPFTRVNWVALSPEAEKAYAKKATELGIAADKKPTKK